MAQWKTITQTHPAVQHLIKKDKRLAKVIAMVGDIEYEEQADCFARLVRSIVNQMLSNKVARILRDRLAALCGGQITSEAVLKLSRDQLRETGVSYAKADAILNAARAVVDGKIHFSNFPRMTDEEVIKELTTLKGVGVWSAKMYLIFTLNRPDVLPYEDGAFLQSYAWLYKTNELEPRAIMKRCKKWKPYSSFAARYLYYALDMGLTKKEFHLFRHGNLQQHAGVSETEKRGTDVLC